MLVITLVFTSDTNDFFVPLYPIPNLCLPNGQIPLLGTARIPEVSLSQEAFEFGSLTAGGCEPMEVTLINKGPIPASLQLDLSQYEEFHLERITPMASRGDAGRGAASDPSPPGGGNTNER